MKYAIALLLGITVGAAGFVALMYGNPFSVTQALSPLAVSELPLLNLQYAGAPQDQVFFTNNGETTTQPHPDSAGELWEGPLRDTRIVVAELVGVRGAPVGIGIKFSTNSESTRLLNSQVLVDSAWHLYLPGRGTLFVNQKENYWAYLRDIVIKARLNSANSWRGVWNRTMTVGPNPIGTGKVIGGNGAFSGAVGEIVESLNATAYSADQGPVAINGTLTIALPADSRTANVNR